MSVRSLARKIGRTDRTVAVLERGETQDTKVSIVFDIARLFGVPLEWLADDEQDWPPPRSDEQTAADLVKRALAGAGLPGKLDPLEAEILTMIRSLHPAQKFLAKGMILGLSGRGIRPEEEEAYLREGLEEGRTLDEEEPKRGNQQ